MKGSSETPPTRFRVFDIHLHAYRDPGSFREWARVDFGAWRKWPRTYTRTPALQLRKTIEHMDLNNVRKGLVSRDNAEAWVRAHPSRFLASFTPDFGLSDHSEAAERFSRDVGRGKWSALGELGLAYRGWALNQPAFFPYYEVCERRGIPACFHTGFDGAENRKYRAALADPLLLEEIVDQFPRLKVVIMHMGWPFFDHALYMLYAFRNVYLDTGAVDWILARSLFERMLQEAVETVGCDRILFGSDQMVWPQMITRAVRSLAEAPCLTDSDRRRIFWDNAQGLLGAR